MVAFDGSEACQKAEAHYHDYLEDPGGPSLTESVVRHIEGCTYCQNRIRMLREAICEVDGDPQPAQVGEDSQLIATLRSHFERLEEPLSCADIKPFLFGLACSAVRIRIPTPITVHVDQCAQCAEDLESLRQLELDVEVSDRLGQVCRSDMTPDPDLCRRSQPYAAAFAAMAFETIPADLLDHMCVCPSCRDRVEQLQRGPVEGMPQPIGQIQPCLSAGLTHTELFDCAVPYGRAPEFFRADRQRAVCEHVRSCPRCLETVHQIRQTLGRIMERPDSGVVTVYTAQNREAASGTHRERAWQGSCDVDVQVTRGSVATMSDLKSRSRLTRSASTPNPKTFGRIAFLTAAMIPLAVLFFLSMPSASGLSVRQIDYILGQARNVHISTFNDGEVKPFQQQWISRDSQIILFELETEQRIYDLGNRQATVIEPSLGVVDRFAMNVQQYEAGQRAMQRFLASSLDGAPVDAELTHRPAGSRPAHDGLDVYELTWDRSSGTGIPMPRRLKIYIDPITRLPQRQEFSTWVPGINDWRVQTTVYEYPDKEVVAARREALLSAK